MSLPLFLAGERMQRFISARLGGGGAALVERLVSLSPHRFVSDRASNPGARRARLSMRADECLAVR